MQLCDRKAILVADRVDVGGDQHETEYFTFRIQFDRVWGRLILRIPGDWISSKLHISLYNQSDAYPSHETRLL